MQILSIHLKNIKSHRDTHLDFAAGINVLSGPNGVGKSTIFEAIGYALFGVDAQSFVGNVERFITIGAKRGEIALIFQLTDGQKYRVSRTVGIPAKWLLARQVGGEFEVEEHKDSKETEARLKVLLGLNGGRSLAEQFELVIGPFQNEFLGPFVIRQPTRRRDKFDEILGIDGWRKTFAATSALQKAIKTRIEIAEGAIGPLQDQVMALPEKREALSNARQTRDETETKYKNQQVGLKKLETQLTEIDKHEQALKTLTVEIDKLRERVGNGKERVGSQKTLITEAQKANNIVGENTFGWQAYEKVEQRLVVLRGQIKLQRQLEKEVAEQNLQVSRLVERHAAETKVIKQTERDLLTEEQRLVEKRSSLAVDEPLKTRADRLPEIGKAVTALQNQIGRLDGRRVGLEEGQEKLAEGICPFFQEPCMNISERPPGDVFTAKFTDLRQERDLLRVEFTRREQEEALARNASEQLKAIEIQIKGVAELSAALVTKRQKNNARADGLDGLQNQRALAQQQLDEKQEALKAYCQLQGDIALAESEQKKHQQARDLYLANLGSAAKLEGLQAESKKFARLLACLQDELADKEKQQVAASKDYSADQHQTLRQQKDSLRQEVGALGQKVEWLKVEVERLTCEIDKLRKIEQEIAVKQQQIKAYGKREELVKFLRNRVFRNVSASLSERFREEISQRADRIYRIIAETDEELCWGDDYRILLRDMVDGELRERADDQLSGGQIMSAVVALRLAMLQTIGARIAFFDEPTSNLDATRRENLAHAFRAIDVGKEDLTEHWYDQLFLISHDVAFTEVTDQIVHLDPGS